MSLDRAIIIERLANVRKIMLAQGCDGLLVPTADPHQSEYVPPRWQGRAWLTGVEGSAGAFVMTQEKAAFCVDSRYWEQAEAILAGTGIELAKVTNGRDPVYPGWLAQNVPSGGTVYVDGDVMSVAAAKALKASLTSSGVVLNTGRDLLEVAWSGRPPTSSAPAYEHAVDYAVRPRPDKLAAIRARLANTTASHVFVSSLDEIAWLTNLRGTDIEFNPYFLAYLLLSADKATLFVAEGKLSPDLIVKLEADGFTIAPYTGAKAALASLPKLSTLLIDPVRTSLSMMEASGEGSAVIEQTSLIMLEKSVKTPAEIALFRNAMIQDGAAMVRFYAEFESSMARGEPWDEYKVHTELTAERAKSALFVSPSFLTSAGFAGNGAMPHYMPAVEGSGSIAGDGFLLIDSGGQFLTGTSDVCRVWAIGEPTQAAKQDFTIALKGLIALSSARFPKGTPAPLLDALARGPLWAHGLNYFHGTGHGVGYFLGVHEGPQLFSAQQIDPNTVLLPGMISAVEPGVYRSGQWGVRHENILVCVETPNEGYGDFLAFETLTMCPIDTRCILAELLNDCEKSWLNSYHADIAKTLLPHLTGSAQTWLETRTRPI